MKIEYLWKSLRSVIKLSLKVQNNGEIATKPTLPFNLF